MFYSSLNNTTQTTGTHTTHTHADLLCVDGMILLIIIILRAADHPKLQTLAGTDAGSAVGLLDWWKRHPEEESSAAIGLFWSHQSRSSASTSAPRTLGGGSIFKFCVCNIMYVSISVCVGDGGHGYLKDWLWWGGLLTSKICSLFH